MFNPETFRSVLFERIILRLPCTFNLTNNNRQFQHKRVFKSLAVAAEMVDCQFEKLFTGGEEGKEEVSGNGQQKYHLTFNK
jgi:hypothetical protein